MEWDSAHALDESTRSIVVVGRGHYLQALAREPELSTYLMQRDSLSAWPFRAHKLILFYKKALEDELEE